MNKRLQRIDTNNSKVSTYFSPRNTEELFLKRLYNSAEFLRAKEGFIALMKRSWAGFNPEENLGLSWLVLGNYVHFKQEAKNHGAVEVSNYLSDIAEYYGLPEKTIYDGFRSNPNDPFGMPYIRRNNIFANGKKTKGDNIIIEIDARTRQKQINHLWWFVEELQAEIMDGTKHNSTIENFDLFWAIWLARHKKPKAMKFKDIAASLTAGTLPEYAKKINWEYNNVTAYYSRCLKKLRF